jgi:hypothetical protein
MVVARREKSFAIENRTFYFSVDCGKLNGKGHIPRLFGDPLAIPNKVSVRSCTRRFFGGAGGFYFNN